jgi:hypothetical protein
MQVINRRQFLQSGSAGALLAMSGAHSVYGANDKIVVGAIGTSRNQLGADGRGTHLARCFAGCPNTEVAYVCDVDRRNVEKAIESVSQVQRQPPKGVTDFRRILDAIRAGAKLNAEIEEGYKSVLLCHLGNISYRLGRSIPLDPAMHQIAGDKEASDLWGREYRPGWEPQV